MQADRAALRDVGRPDERSFIIGKALRESRLFGAGAAQAGDQRALWLEKLFINSAFVFEVKGAERFYFKERLSDNYITVNGQRIFSRPLRFFLRYREFDAKAVSIMKQILIDAKILPNF